MANHASAQKRNRQNVRRAARNRTFRSALKTTLKNARSAIEEGNKEQAQGLVLGAERALAQAASKGVIHSNTAARKTARIYKALHKLA